VGYDDADVVLLSCADAAGRGLSPARNGAAWWPSPGRRPRTVTLPPRPGRADLDPVLAEPALRRIVVAGTDADLAAVLLRLLRADRLAVELAYVPADRRSAAARVWGLPHGAAAVELARTGVARPVPLVRDDAGGVLVGRAEIRTVHGEVYCDEVLVLRGSARRLVVTPWPGRGVERIGVAVRAGRWGGPPDGRTRPVPATARTGVGAATGRAVQVGCLPATVVHDGVAHPRPVTRWAWYRHVTDWLLVRP
jgi:hypothetical protein